MNALSWFEVPTTDFDRGVTFYETILGCSMRRMEVPGAHEPIRMALFPSDSDGVGGALVYLPEHRPATAGPLLYLNANPDLNVVLSRVEQAGGTIIMTKTELPNNFGFMAIFIDCEGNHMALHSINPTVLPSL